MKRSAIIFLLFILNSCAMSGYQWIHSPSAPYGIPLRSRHVHGGVTKSSPADLLYIKTEGPDPISLVFSARTISEKLMWGGILFPVVPIPFFPKIDHYKSDPNTLTIYLRISGNSEIRVIPDSIFILNAGQTIYARETIFHGADAGLIDI